MIDFGFSPAIRQLATDVLARSADYWIVTAESCTGGLLAAALTNIPGSSDSFDRGFVTYSNMAKSELLSISAELIVTRGAVSKEVAEAMATGAIKAASKTKPASIGVGVTGIAGPGGGSPEKPVGLVHIAAARSSVGADPIILHEECRFGPLSREEIRRLSVDVALRLMLRVIAR